MEEEIISLAEILQALKKRWLLILLIALFCSGVSAAASIYLIQPMYQTSTKLFIGKEQNSVEGYDSNEVSLYQKLLKTYSETIMTKDLITRAIDKTNYNLYPGSVLGGLNVVSIPDTQILQIIYTSNDPTQAKEMLEAITDEFVITSKELVPNGNVRVIESVSLPQYPISPNRTRNVAIAFIFGVAVGVALVFLLEYMNNTFKSKEQLENNLEIPVLGVIPELEVK